MRLYEREKDTVEHCGKTYKLNLGWQNVLASLDALDDPELSEKIKIEVALANLIIGKHPDEPKLLEKVIKTIFPGTNKNSGEPVIDFEQDSPLIFSAFWQAYRINLHADALTWREFTELLQGIPRGTRLADRIEIRQREIPEPTKYNAKERAALIKAKAEVAIKKTPGQKEKALRGLYSMLEAQAKGR